MLVTPKINNVMLNRGADCYFEGENVCVAMGTFAAKDLPAALEANSAEKVMVEYRTIGDPKARKRDQAKYTKRLSDLRPTFVRGPWTNKVVKGFVFGDVMTCTLDRVNQES